MIRRAREDPIGGAVNRRARLVRGRVEAERGQKSVDPVDPSSGGWFREQVAAPEDDEPELGQRLPSLLTAPVTARPGRGNRARRPPIREIQHPAPGRGSRSTCGEASDRRPSAEPSRQVVLGRHSTEARRGVVSQPVTATRANRWLTSRATPDAPQARLTSRECPLRHPAFGNTCGLTHPHFITDHCAAKVTTPRVRR